MGVKRGNSDGQPGEVCMRLMVMDGNVTKPFDPAVLIDAVERSASGQASEGVFGYMGKCTRMS